MTRDAAISPCGLYRYWLLREWDPSLPRMCSFMLNPSTADSNNDDPTLMRNIGFARQWGYGGLEVVNPYAYRTPFPRVLVDAKKQGVDVVGPHNKIYIATSFYRCKRIMVGWGAAPWAQADAHAVLRDFPDLDFYCFGRTNEGAPKHPLYLSYDRHPSPFRPAMEGRTLAS